jgi:hypothetical protein
MSKKAVLDILTSFFDVVAFPLLDNNHRQEEGEEEGEGEEGEGKKDASSNNMFSGSPSTNTTTTTTTLVKFSSSPGIKQLNFFQEIYQFWPFWLSLLEEPPTNKDCFLIENLMWTFAFGNAMLWCHSA